MASFDGTKNYLTLQQRTDLHTQKKKPLKLTRLNVCITTLCQMCCFFLDTHPNVIAATLHKVNTTASCKGKGKGHPRTGHEGPEWGSRGIALLFL
jgi:hypothetical protein